MGARIPMRTLEIDSQYHDIDEINTKFEQTDNFKYKVLHLNIHGLRSSLDLLKHMINRLEENNIFIDFILICETFLHGHDPNKEYKKICEIPG